MKRGFLKRPDPFKSPNESTTATGGGGTGGPTTLSNGQETCLSPITGTSYPTSTLPNSEKFGVFTSPSSVARLTVLKHLSEHESLNFSPPDSGTFTQRWEAAGCYGVCTRICRTPDRGRVIGVWISYIDMNTWFGLQHGWTDPPTPLPRPYEIVPIIGTGLGMRAVRAITAGETIVVERPLVMLPRNMSCDWDEEECILEKAVEHLDPGDRRRLRALKNCKPSTLCGPLSGTMRTNTLLCYFPQSQIIHEYAGVCLDISRANHSCTPNATYAFDNKAVLMEMRAVTSIAAGEEITITYLSPFDPRSGRQEVLRKDYCFTCSCPACALSATADVQASDARRSAIIKGCIHAPALWQMWFDAGHFPAARLLTALRELFTMIEQEGLHGERGVPARWLAYTYAALGDEVNFGIWAADAARSVRLLNNNNEGFLPVEDWERWRLNPISVPFWGERAPKPEVDM